MYYNPETLLFEKPDDVTRSYLEIPIHFLESIGIKHSGTPVKLIINENEKSLTITILEPHEQ
jgi:hypothetical protein